MNDFFNMNWLVINKAGEFKYFKNMKNIAEYLNTTTSKIAASKIHCHRYYNKYCTKRNVYIQCLYNDPIKQYPIDTTFIWDPHNRAIFYKHKLDNYPKLK
tara:strand:- start:3079 stop:3378 length:300 start_codon:yes stop_codon:yes gene_type:complete